MQMTQQPRLLRDRCLRLGELLGAAATHRMGTLGVVMTFLATIDRLLTELITVTTRRLRWPKALYQLPKDNGVACKTARFDFAKLIRMKKINVTYSLPVEILEILEVAVRETGRHKNAIIEEVVVIHFLQPNHASGLYRPPSYQRR